MKPTALISGLVIAAFAFLADLSTAFAKEQCPAGPTDIKSLLERRVAVRFGKKPVRINPDGACEMTLWNRHCIYLRQAGETKTLGPFCPAGEPPLKGAIITGPQFQFPPDIEWAWSAVQPFTVYVALSPLSQGHPRFSDAPPPSPPPGNAMIDCELADGAKVRTTSSACDVMYSNGRGTARDLTQAYLWLTLAVKMLPAGAERKAASKNLAVTAMLCKKEQIEEAERLAALFEAKPEE